MLWPACNCLSLAHLQLRDALGRRLPEPGPPAHVHHQVLCRQPLQLRGCLVLAPQLVHLPPQGGQRVVEALVLLQSLGGQLVHLGAGLGQVLQAVGEGELHIKVPGRQHCPGRADSGGVDILCQGG